MRKLLFIFTAVILAASCRAQSPGIPIKTAGIVYSKGVPQWVPQLKSGSEIDIDTTTGHIYQWHRTNNSWLQLGQGIDVISGTIPPLYTPVRNMSLFAINAADELYHWTGSGWVQINQGTAYTAGAGIDITGDEISNTGDLSNTNELQTITTSTNTLTLSNSGGTVTVDTDPTNEAQTLSAGGTTSPTIGLSTAGGAGGGTVTLSPAGIMFFSRTGNTIIATATEVDGSVTNEIELPAQTGNSGKYLTTDGSAVSWGTVSAGITGTLAANRIVYATGTSAVTTSSTLTYDGTELVNTGRTKAVVQGREASAGAAFSDTYTRILFPQGATANLSGTGAIRISIPNTGFSSSGNSYSMRVVLMDLGRATSVPMDIYFSATNTTVFDVSAQYTGTAVYTVRSGYNSGDATINIYIGSVSDTWSSCGAVVTEFVAKNGNGSAPNSMLTGWSTTLVTSLPTTVTSTTSLTYASGLAGNVTVAGNITANGINKGPWIGAEVSDGSNFNPGWVRCINPTGGQKQSFSGTGALTVQVPTNIFNAAGGTSACARIIVTPKDAAPQEYIVMWTGSPTQVFDAYCTSFGKIDRAVRVGYNSTDGKIDIYIGELATVWTNTNVSVDYALAENSNSAVPNNLRTGWNVKLSTAFPGSYQTVSSSLGYAKHILSGAGVGTTSPAASAALDITSTTSGFLPPRMTTAQRNAISSPATGLTIYCTDATATDASTGVLQCYNGTTWKNCW